ncbi:MerR family transcriptional regulator [Patescibacteria group bacterium]
MKKMRKSDPLFTISVASELAKLHPRTLMLYEKNGLIKPHRTPTGRRRYSQKDLEAIKFVHYLTRQKSVNLAGIRVIFSVLKETGKTSLKIMNKIFPDYKK